MRASVSRESTSADAAATTDVPEPPFGDQKHTSIGFSPRSAPSPLRRGRARQQKRGRNGGSRARKIRARDSTSQEARATRPLGFASVEAAFFDLDKTVIATSSVMALGGTLYRDGLISKRTIVRGLYAQVVYLLV